MHLGSARVVVFLIALSAGVSACNVTASTPDGDGDAADQDAAMSVDSGPPQDDGVDPLDVTPVGDVMLDVPIGDPLPPFDPATQQHVRDLVAMGRSRGNHPEVFAKIGDSISESASFLFDCGFGWIRLGDHSDLASTIAYFSSFQLGDRNSLNRASECAVAGWSADQALENYPNAPLVQELNDTHPLYAIVMYGTNDLERWDVSTYAGNMSRIVDIIEQNGTVPVLSTIPPRLDGEPYASRVPVFNDAIRSLAVTRHIPLIDFWAALQSATNNGIGADGIHPNVYSDPSDPNSDSCYFTSDALQFGYNVRNLTALQMLARLQTYGAGG